MKVYSLSNKGAKRLVLRMGSLLLIGIAMAAIVFFLGLERWAMNQYILVNAGLLLIDIVCVSTWLVLGGFLDKKANKGSKSIIVIGVSAVVGVVTWVALTIAKAHEKASLLVFLLSVGLTLAICYKAFNMVKSFMQTIGNDTDKSGNKIHYPGSYMLNEVHTTDALTSPMGKVLIAGHAVLFVLVNQYKGHVLVNPDGSLEIRKIKGLFENKSSEGTINYSEMTYNGACGAQRMMEIVKQECEKQAIAQPDMVYDFAIFLPNFKQGNYVFNENWFESYSWTDKLGSYKQYLKSARSSDYFRGRACFTAEQLNILLRKMNASAAGGNSVSEGDASFVAEAIAQACELVPKQ